MISTPLTLVTRTPHLKSSPLPPRGEATEEVVLELTITDPDGQLTTGQHYLDSERRSFSIVCLSGT